MLGIREFKAGFFDTAAIRKQIDRETKKRLSEKGGYVRKVARNSLKYGKGSSPAGSPPTVHGSRGFTRTKTNKKTGAVSRQAVSQLRELIFFAYDAATKSVVIGPAAFGPRKAGVIEKGGDGTFRDPKTGRTKRGHWQPHPFMRPAGEAEARRAAVRGMVK